MDIPKIRAYLKELENGTLPPEQKEWLLRFMENATESDWEAIFPEQEWDMQPAAAAAPGELDSVFEDVLSRAKEQPKGKIVPLSGAWWQKNWIKAAAVAAVTITAVSMLLRPGHNDQQPAKIIANASIVWKTLATSCGERVLIHLPDSSEIYVNGSSKVMFPETFVNGIREIRLIEGEVFLEVAKDPARPFQVSTAGLTVKVLGTSFNVRNYRDEKQADIAVRTGKVAVCNAPDKDGLLLLPGNKAVFGKGSGKLELSAAISPAHIGGWIKNELVFNDMSLKDVFRNLKYNYGLEFQVLDSTILSKHVRATFRNKTKEEIVKLIAQMAQFKYQLKDSLVIVR